MNKLGAKELHTDRLILRKLNIDDAEQLYLNVFSDDKTAQYMSWNPYSDVDSVKNYLTKWQEYYAVNECYWGVFTKDTNTLVGTICLSDENSKADIAFVSYCLGSKYWGNGYMTESIKPVMEYAFNELEYRMITAFCTESNRSSQKVLTRLGFKYEATLRQRDLTAFGYEDCYQYSILADEAKKDFCEVAVTLKPVEQNERDTLNNLLEKYFYEFSQYDGGKFGNQGVFGYKYIDNYFTEENRFAYFIMVEDRLAGFAMLNNHPELGLDKRIDWSIAEFFVAYNYRRQGVATKAVELLFEKHKGYYHIKFHKKNLASVALWNKIADKYSNGTYETLIGNTPFRDGTEATVLWFEVK